MASTWADAVWATAVWSGSGDVVITPSTIPIGWSVVVNL
jgi:hypothetical protein